MARKLLYEPKTGMKGFYCAIQVRVFAHWWLPAVIEPKKEQEILIYFTHYSYSVNQSGYEEL